MAIVLRQTGWALLYAVLALPFAYGITMLLLSWIHHGYVRVDPVRLRRITVALAAMVFVFALLAEHLH